jgi:O-acetyl-ADP-ribose deacetylase (regulator of RNase III)
MLQVQSGNSTLILLQGDITQQDTDAIVNAANTSLRGGGGVDGAIHRAAGPELLAECRTLGGCPTGEARITRGYKLKARYVIHTVGPVWRGGKNFEEDLLHAAYRNSLQLAVENKIVSIAFPSISTGAYGFPIEKASRIAFSTVKAFVEKHRQPREVRFVVFSQSDYDVYAPLFHIG